MTPSNLGATNAFPIAFAHPYSPGMTLRQWLAGMALQGIACKYNFDPEDWKRSAEVAIGLTDALLIELSEGENAPTIT